MSSIGRVMREWQRRSLERREFQAVLAVVDSVSEIEGTCDVSPVDASAQLFDVMLTVATGDVVTVLPTVGSLVVVDFYDDARAFVACFSESESWSSTHGQHVVKHSRSGLEVTRQSDNLAKAIEAQTKLTSDLIDLLTRFIMVTPAGPTIAVDPATILSLQQLKLQQTQIQAHFNRLLT